MLQIDRPDRPLPRSLLEAPGGFAWWYADAVDASGSGFVCIWSYGLPFLPGYMGDHRRGRAPGSGRRPSLNLAVYEAGRPIFYTLLELPEDRATWRDDSWRFGDSTFTFRPEGGRDVLTATLDLPVPGRPGRLTGGFTVAGPRMRPPGGEVPDRLQHAWTPRMGPATATAELHLDDRLFWRFSGTGYHDRNGSEHAMIDLGIDHWIWGRQILGDQLVIYYLTWPTDPDAPPLLELITVGPDGVLRRTDDVAVTLGRRRRAWFGMPWWDTLVVEGLAEPLHLRFAPPLDDGPFYLRALTEAAMGRHRARGIAELCRPDRIDADWMRPLVKMAVQQERGPNSLWLPLFVGTQHDRWSRLLPHALPSRGAP